jgi:hypothetical protein
LEFFGTDFRGDGYDSVSESDFLEFFGTDFRGDGYDSVSSLSFTRRA